MTLTGKTIALHDAYLPYRNPTVPFPAESVAMWCYLLALQQEDGLVGDMLELGVEHGGTAFLAAQSLRAGERFHLVDIKRSPQFSDMEGRLRQTVRDQLVFHECNSDSPKLNVLAEKRYRLIHIDAGHLYPAVKKDLERFAHCLLPNGVVCIDDVFEIRWPEVTEAVLDYLPRSDVAPVAFVNRKLYAARRTEAAAVRQRFIDELDTLNAFGTMRHWKERLRGTEILIVKLQPDSAVCKGPLAPPARAGTATA